MLSCITAARRAARPLQATATRSLGATAAPAFARSFASQRPANATPVNFIKEALPSASTPTVNQKIAETAAASQQTQQKGMINAAQALSRQVPKKGLFFEFSMFWVLSAYKDIAIGLVRNFVYTFRPVIMFFVSFSDG